MVVDPVIAFGKPTVDGLGITTRVLADFYTANGHDARAVARWNQVDEDLVNAAVAFEGHLAA